MGTGMLNFGQRIFTGIRKIVGLGFEVCDVRKPLVAVWRFCEKGNIVQFGPRDEDCFISNIESGDKVFMRRGGGSYVLDIQFVEEGFQRQGK